MNVGAAHGEKACGKRCLQGKSGLFCATEGWRRIERNLTCYSLIACTASLTNLDTSYLIETKRVHKLIPPSPAFQLAQSYWSIRAVYFYPSFINPVIELQKRSAIATLSFRFLRGFISQNLWNKRSFNFSACKRFSSEMRDHERDVFFYCCSKHLVEQSFVIYPEPLTSNMLIVWDNLGLCDTRTPLPFYHDASFAYSLIFVKMLSNIYSININWWTSKVKRIVLRVGLKEISWVNEAVCVKPSVHSIFSEPFP